MRLTSVNQSPSPDDANAVRLAGRLEPQSGQPFEVWFDVPARLQEDLSVTANPWLVCMLPFAMESGEPIEADLPADPQLVDNLCALQVVWRSWYPVLHRSEFVVPSRSTARDLSASRRSAAFFSGGVDSWFTILRHAPEIEPAAVGTVDELINVQGFDIPLDRPEELRCMNDALGEGARAIHRDFASVRTNLRRPGSLWHRGWGWLTNAAGLAAVALVLERRYSEVLIGSSHHLGHLFPWGSHPLTDPLLSSSHLRVVHDGAAFDRVEKTGLVARHDVARRRLHVCWQHGAASNCGRCSKCVRTMATLSLFGVSARECAFPLEFDPSMLWRQYVPDQNEEHFVREIRLWAARFGKPEIEAAAGHALARSRRRRPLVAAANHLSSVPVLWRLHSGLTRWLVGPGEQHGHVA